MPLEFATGEDQIRGHMAMTAAVRRLTANQRSGEVLRKQLTFGCVQVRHSLLLDYHPGCLSQLASAVSCL